MHDGLGVGWREKRTCREAVAVFRGNNYLIWRIGHVTRIKRYFGISLLGNKNGFAVFGDKCCFDVSRHMCPLETGLIKGYRVGAKR